MKVLVFSVLLIISVAGYRWFTGVSESNTVDSRLSLITVPHQEERASVEHRKEQDDEHLPVIFNNIGVVENNINNVADDLEHAIQSGNNFADLEPLYEIAYETCNGELNALYGVFAKHSDAESVPAAMCLRIKTLLADALDRTEDFDEKILLVEMLARWEPIGGQLAFIRSYAAIPPTISGLDLANLERNSLYISSSVEDKASVISTFSTLPYEAKIESANVFFQTFVPLVLTDSSQGVDQYFPQLAAVAESYPMPDIPEDIERTDLLQLAQKVPDFTNEHDFNLWAINNPDALEDILNLAESFDSNNLSVGALDRIELSTSLRGQNPSPSSLSNILENDPDDITVYHVLREINSLRDDGEYFGDYYREIQQNEMVRNRADILIQNPTLSDGQRSSVKKLYDEIWGRG